VRRKGNRKLLFYCNEFNAIDASSFITLHAETNMSNFLIIAATQTEIIPFLKENKVKNGLHGNHSTDILITGVGLVATTYSLTRHLAYKRPDFIIQAGIAGSYDTSIKTGTVVVVKKEIIADQMVIEKGKLKTLFDLNLADQNKPPYTKAWLLNKSETLKKTKLNKVTGISVNEITTNKKKIDLFRDTYHPVVESMEGAALHYVCLLEKIPFLQIRSISNYIGERNKTNWDIAPSILNLNQELLNLLHIL